ncbi:YkgJ family cysteine cluster protein [Stutzerimonas azotifigens]|uniref:YkgJ family cysteine cluster protein n=1 Tax=Stutzerimonas azotifigens TaxID=291995 RepID=UPI001F237718|nr:YkgJ family cysteine cluster protein [Stutzerimonas azotifigens]
MHGPYHEAFILTLEPFPCDKCGLCCQRVNLAPETQFLNRGDGTCRHYDELEKGCGIYDQRPDICRVDRQYKLNYSKRYSWGDFVAANIEVCLALQAEAQEKKHSSLDDQ